MDDGNGNLKGIKMVNVRWEKIDGQMRYSAGRHNWGQASGTGPIVRHCNPLSFSGGTRRDS